VKTLLYVDLALMILGIALLVVGYRHREPSQPFISFSKYSINPGSWRPAFRDDLGFRLAVAGKYLLSLGGGIAAIYWFTR
jgi:hypothetical protein